MPHRRGRRDDGTGRGAAGARLPARAGPTVLHGAVSGRSEATDQSSAARRTRAGNAAPATRPPHNPRSPVAFRHAPQRRPPRRARSVARARALNPALIPALFPDFPCPPGSLISDGPQSAGVARTRPPRRISGTARRNAAGAGRRADDARRGHCSGGLPVRGGPAAEVESRARDVTPSAVA